MRKVPNPKPLKLISLVHQGHLEAQIQILTVRLRGKKNCSWKKHWVSTLNCCFDANDQDKLVALNFSKNSSMTSMTDDMHFTNYQLDHLFFPNDLGRGPRTEPPYHEPTRIMAPCRCAATPMSRVASLCWLKVWKATDKSKNGHITPLKTKMSP